VFIPLQTEYGTMEFGMLLWYKGVRVVPDSLANGRPGVVVLEGPQEFAGGKCVPFKVVPCTHVARPTPGAMILTFPEDEPPGLDNASLRPAGPSITVYEPYLFPGRCRGSDESGRDGWLGRESEDGLDVGLRGCLTGRSRAALTGRPPTASRNLDGGPSVGRGLGG
jgi:hypothetical protein